MPKRRTSGESVEEEEEDEEGQDVRAGVRALADGRHLTKRLMSRRCCGSGRTAVLPVINRVPIPTPPPPPASAPAPAAAVGAPDMRAKYSRADRDPAAYSLAWSTWSRRNVEIPISGVCGMPLRVSAVSPRSVLP